MLVTRERPTVFQIARRAWGSLDQALLWIAPLLIAGLALLSARDAAFAELHDKLGIATLDALEKSAKSGVSIGIAAVLPSFGLDMAVNLITALLTAPIAVAMHRFVLLEEIRRFTVLTPVTLRFAAWIFAFDTLAMIGISTATLAHNGLPLLSGLLMVVLAVGLVILVIKTLVLFPAVAVEEQSDRTSNRIETALNRSNGIFWLTVWSFMLASLPLGLVQAVTIFLLRHFNEPPIFIQLCRNAVTILTVALGAAVASYLYSYAAHRGTPAAQP